MLTIAALAVPEGRKVRCIDTAEAYLKSEMKDGEVTVYMTIDAEMTKLMCQLDPSYRAYITDKVKVIVELDHALYGICEAGLMWYKNIKGKLLTIEYFESEYDQCVSTRQTSQGCRSL